METDCKNGELTKKGINLITRYLLLYFLSINFDYHCYYEFG